MKKKIIPTWRVRGQSKKSARKNVNPCGKMESQTKGKKPQPQSHNWALSQRYIYKKVSDTMD